LGEGRSKSGVREKAAKIEFSNKFLEDELSETREELSQTRERMNA
jgi:hypothetical protein